MKYYKVETNKDNINFKFDGFTEILRWKLVALILNKY